MCAKSLNALKPYTSNSFMTLLVKYTVLTMFCRIWVIPSTDPFARGLAFADPKVSDSGTYTCHSDGWPSVATYIDIEFVGKSHMVQKMLFLSPPEECGHMPNFVGDGTDDDLVIQILVIAKPIRITKIITHIYII